MKVCIICIYTVICNLSPLVELQTAAFVGQGSSKATNSTGAAARGQKQTEQVDTIAKFRKGECNVLVATCIGEEGLDIGEVGIIVMFDAVGSPIR